MESFIADAIWIWCIINGPEGDFNVYRTDSVIDRVGFIYVDSILKYYF